MNSRQAKKQVLRSAAAALRTLAPPEHLSLADQQRWYEALRGLVAELEQRGGRPPVVQVEGQLSIEDAIAAMR